MKHFLGVVFICDIFQEFGNIPVTGRIDRETKELLKKPRCGLPDNAQSSQHRWRRFTQQGQIWNHTDLTWRSVKVYIILYLLYFNLQFNFSIAILLADLKSFSE